MEEDSNDQIPSFNSPCLEYTNITDTFLNYFFNLDIPQKNQRLPYEIHCYHNRQPDQPNMEYHPAYLPTDLQILATLPLKKFKIFTFDFYISECSRRRKTYHQLNVRFKNNFKNNDHHTFFY